MRRETFHTPGPLLLNLGVPAGRIDLETVDGEETVVELDAADEVEEEARIELRPRRDGHEVIVEIERRGGFLRRQGEVRLRVTAPPGAEVEVSTASADVEGRGVFGRVEVESASGDVAFDQVESDAEIQSASGDVRVARVQGSVAVNTASGDIELEYVDGPGKIRSASGDVAVGEAGSSLKVQTASGDQEIRTVSEGEVTLQSASGDISIGIKQGSKLWIDARSMSGETSSELEVGDAPPNGEGPFVEVRATAMSGDIRVRRA